MPEVRGWLTFHERLTPDRQRTREWQVAGSDGSRLGEVKWFTRWRCYAFLPYVGTVFERRCLRDLASFCEDRTVERKREREQERARERSSS